MFCTKCGAQLLDNAVFCGKCGTRVFLSELLNKQEDNRSESVEEGILQEQQKNLKGEEQSNVAESMDISPPMISASSNGSAFRRDSVNTVRKAASILSVAATVFFLLSKTKYTILFYYLLTLGSLVLLSFGWLTGKKRTHHLFSISVAVFALRFLITDFGRLFGIYNYSITFMVVLSRLALYCFTYCVIEMVLKKEKPSGTLRSIGIISCIIVIIDDLVDLFKVSSFSTIMFYLGLICFILSALFLLFDGAEEAIEESGSKALSGFDPMAGLEAVKNQSAKTTRPDRTDESISGTIIEQESQGDADIQMTDLESEQIIMHDIPQPAKEPEPEREPVSIDSASEMSFPSQDSDDFMSRAQFIIDEKIAAFKFANAYRIYDTQGEVIGAVEQVNISGGAKAARLLLGSNVKNLQSFQYNVLDKDGNVRAIIKRSGLSGGMAAMRQIHICDENENVIGYFSFMSGWKLRIQISDTENKPVCFFSGDWKGKNFMITDTEERQIGEINKQFTGIARELFTTADRYIVTLHNSLDGHRRRLITASAITIDMVLHEFSYR